MSRLLGEKLDDITPVASLGWSGVNTAVEVQEHLGMASDLAAEFGADSLTALDALSNAEFSAVFPTSGLAETDFSLVDPTYLVPLPDADISAAAAEISVGGIYDQILVIVNLLLDEAYVSNIEQALRSSLYDSITNGGTGLAEDVEAAIYERASDRLEYELSKDYDAALANFEAWGMELPDGILAANLGVVVAEGARRRAELSKDVMISQAELAQKNSQFAVTSGLTFEKQRLDYVAAINDTAAKLLGEAVEALKAEVTRSSSQAEIDVRAYAARVEAFKGQAGLASAFLSAQAETYKASAAQDSSNADLVAKEAESNLRVAAMLTELRTEALKAVANITAQKVASALSVLNVSASIGATQAISNNLTTGSSYSFTETNNDSTSEIHQTTLSGPVTP